MKKAIIYTRVSTDDQADHGYSLPHQEEVIRRYCTIKKIDVVKHFQEDYSAKNFENRPDWKKLYSFVKANKKEIDVILFTKWDRFSRNVAAAYQVIDKLKAIEVTVNAIEQPLDMSVPDSKIMLAVYLAIPEVENDKISIRTKEGSRKANKYGAWTSTAPVGYRNQRTELGQASLVSTEKAELIKRNFRNISYWRI